VGSRHEVGVARFESFTRFGAAKTPLAIKNEFAPNAAVPVFREQCRTALRESALSHREQRGRRGSFGNPAIGSPIELTLDIAPYDQSNGNAPNEICPTTVANRFRGCARTGKRDLVLRSASATGGRR
jgi:hypothetical protein